MRFTLSEGGMPMVRILSCSLLCMFLAWPARSDDPKQPQERTTTGTVLTGTVLLADGTPAAGAEVWAINTHLGLEQRVTGRTDAQGKVRLQLPPLKKHLHAMWEIRAWQGNQGGAFFFECNLWQGPQPNRFVIRMTPASTVRGRVLQDEDGQPIAGAKVFVSSWQVLETAADGSFRIPGLPMRNHSLHVTAPGRACRGIHFSTALTPQAELELRLVRGMTVTGRVVDEDLQPVANARIRVGSRVGGPASDGLIFRSAADGTFTFDGMGPKERPFWVSASVVSYGEGNVYINSPPDRPLPFVQIILHRWKKWPAERPPTRDVTGVVRDAAGQPIAGAILRTQRRLDGLAQERHTDAQGRFLFHDLPGQKCLLLAQAPGCAPQCIKVSEEMRDITVTMHAGKTAHGQVLKPNGEPLAGATVAPVLWGYYWPLWERGAVTDAEGRYTLHHLPDQVKLRCSHHEYPVAWVPIPQTTDRLPDVTLGSMGVLFGRVIDRQGRPVRNFNVRVQTSLIKPHPQGFDDLLPGFCPQGWTFTAEDGSFRISTGRSGGFVRLVVSAPDHGQVVFDPMLVQPLDAPPVLPVEFQLKPPHRLQVRVTDAVSGKPLPDCLITLLDGENTYTGRTEFNWFGDDRIGESGTTSGDGLVHFDKLSFASAKVLVECPGYGRQWLWWKDGAKELIVELRPEAAMDVKVKGVCKGYVNLRMEGQHEFVASADAANAYQIRWDQLPAGHYVLRVCDADDDENDGQEQEVTLRPGDRLQRTFDFTKPKK
jgi:hypothetical protein